MKKIIIAIDGYSACGKSTTAKRVAEELGYAYIDSGAMYRAVTLYFLDNHVSITNLKEVERALEKINIHFENISGANTTFLNGANVEKQIRKMNVSNHVSEVSTLAVVRHAMVAQQRAMGKRKGVVMDGRDIGTVVFPDAELKVFMTAEMGIRAGRRQLELLEKGQALNLDEIRENLEKRDHIDATREESPLRKADDAVILDTSGITLEEQVQQVVALAKEKMMENA
ncbi:(d)CMP kinase [Fulvivirga sedimenti]|jgi:cytidylate kinase|uniref:Cytidylate kinase n=1 Tax=Fulvivirga sedimenti TaxID=2879465 RepID=A0A9X1HPR1_9BACT|nr:(d)CMP kinase [Fulvivirga sedimenti]MCA6073942.1 (d)CMP kinase [Fulvivirga sedimenti]